MRNEAHRDECNRCRKNTTQLRQLADATVDTRILSGHDFFHHVMTPALDDCLNGLTRADPQQHLRSVREKSFSKGGGRVRRQSVFHDLIDGLSILTGVNLLAATFGPEVLHDGQCFSDRQRSDVIGKMRNAHFSIANGRAERCLQSAAVFLHLQYENAGVRMLFIWSAKRHGTQKSNSKIFFESVIDVIQDRR